MCVRGARSAYHRPQRYDVELASLSGGEGATLILLNIFDSVNYCVIVIYYYLFLFCFCFVSFRAITIIILFILFHYWIIY